VPHGIVPVAVAAIVETLLPPVAIAAREGWLLVAALSSRGAIVAAPLRDIAADVVVTRAISGRVPSTEIVSIAVAPAVAAVVAAIGIAIHVVPFELEPTTASRIVGASLDAFTVSTIERTVVLSRRRSRQDRARGCRQQPSRPVSSTHCRVSPLAYPGDCKRHATSTVADSAAVQACGCG
jgi:hypothetical protein